MENPPFEDVFPIGKGGFPFRHVSLLEGKLQGCNCSVGLDTQTARFGFGARLRFTLALRLSENEDDNWKITMFNRRYIFIHGWFFHCHVSF